MPSKNVSGLQDSTRELFVVVRFDAFHMEDGREFSPDFVSAKRPVYDRQEPAEEEAARLNLQAPDGVHYFVRRLVHPTWPNL